MRQPKRISMLLIAMLLSVLLTACGGNDTSADAGAAGPELSETFTSSDGGVELSFNYPEGWVTQEGEGQIFLANTQEIMDIISSGSLESLHLPDGGYGMQLVLLPTAEMPGDMGPSDLLSMMSEESDSEGVTVGDIEELQINGQEGAKTTITLQENTGEIYLFKSGEYYVMAYAAASTYEDFASITQSMVNTVQIQ